MSERVPPHHETGGINHGSPAHVVVGRRGGDSRRYARICAELAPACDSIERADFLSGIKVDFFLRLAEGARKG